jgi:hypothetical protein
MSDGETDAAAERSASVVRGNPNIAGTNPQDLPLCTGEVSRLIDPFAGPPFGPVQLRAIAERDAARALLPLTWAAGRDACVHAAFSAAIDGQDAGEVDKYPRVSAALRALAPPEDLAERLTRGDAA